MQILNFLLVLLSALFKFRNLALQLLEIILILSFQLILFLIKNILNLLDIRL